ncbi:MAG: hypothetical protein NVS9B3_07720 [Gemmatimonadaceae bacterium]
MAVRETGHGDADGAHDRPGRALRMTVSRPDRCENEKDGERSDDEAETFHEGGSR